MGDVKSIAILGATGHIAKSLIYSFRNEPNFSLHLFTRSVEKTKAFALEIGLLNATIHNYEQFHNYEYSAIINCIGIGDPTRLKTYADEVFFVTEEFDLLAINYLKKHSHTTYINFSSGAVYGTEFSNSVNNSSVTNIAINNITLSDYYGIAKINAEAKHRALHNYNIIDLRIFGFYSRFIETDRPYLLSDILQCLKLKKTLSTTPSNIVRDYIHPNDLAELVKCCMKQQKINTAYDVCSKKPVTKFEILDFIKSKYNFNYSIEQGVVATSVTGNKNNYYSENNNALTIGFEPLYTSLECIEWVTNEILK